MQELACTEGLVTSLLQFEAGEVESKVVLIEKANEDVASFVAPK